MTPRTAPVTLVASAASLVLLLGCGSVLLVEDDASLEGLTASATPALLSPRAPEPAPRARLPTTTPTTIPTRIPTSTPSAGPDAVSRDPSSRTAAPSTPAPVRPSAAVPAPAAVTPGSTAPAPAATPRPEPTATPAPASPSSAVAVDRAYASRLLTLVNEARRSAGLSALALSSCAQDAAVSWARSMATRNTMSHQPLGPVLASCGASRAAENVGYGKVSADRMFRNWMNSPSHRANVLEPGLTHLGNGAARRSDGRVYACQVFLTL